MLAQSALPYWATTYFLDVQSNWVYDVPALVAQVAALHPTVVAIEVGSYEAANGVPSWQFSQSVGQLLSDLGPLHARIFIGNLPAILGPSTVLSQYDADIAAAAKASGAVLVNASAAIARSRGRVIADGILTPVGQQVIASAFAFAVRRNSA
jgi:hypothetical protein